MAELTLALDLEPCPALEAILAEDEKSLPSSDGIPLPDGRIQQGPLNYSRAALRAHLRDRRDRMAVDGDMLVYYVGRDDQGNPKRASVAPDVFVVAGVRDRPDRQSYVLWREPQAQLRFVLEIASKSTRKRDHGEKRTVYASLGVTEYFLYDPPDDHRKPRILGLRLHGKRYLEVPSETLPDGTIGARSETVGLIAHLDENGDLRWFDPDAGRDIEDLERDRESILAKARERDEAYGRLEAVNAQLDRARAERDADRALIAELKTSLRERGG